MHRAGLTKVSLAQANTFAEMGYDTHILTFNFDTRYERIREKLIELGQLNEKVKYFVLRPHLCCKLHSGLLSGHTKLVLSYMMITI